MRIRSVFLGTLISVVVILAMFFAVAVISYFTDVSVSLTNTLFYVSAAMGVFLGALYAARSCGGRVLFNSLAVSVLCVVLLSAVSLAVNGGINTDVHFFSVILAALFAGFLGALFGRR